MIDLICKQCSKTFSVGPNRKNIAKFCSYRCKGLSQKGMLIWNKGLKTGIIPKSVFKKGHISWNKGTKGLYKNPNRALLNKLNPPHTGHEHNDKSKEKISKTKKQLFKEGKIQVWNKGKKMLEETKIKLSIIKTIYPLKEIECLNCGKIFLTKKYDRKFCCIKCSAILHIGENNNNWKNGKSFEEYPKQFKEIRKVVRERDNYRCKLCLKSEEELRYTLIVHHIDENKKNCKLDNLISLCRNCHTKEHWNIWGEEKLQFPV